MADLDHIDHQILRELSRDARQPNTALARKVGLSPSACLRRVQEMERAGLIRGYRVVLDPQRMGCGFIAFVAVGLSEHSKRAQERFEQAVAAMDEVVECHNITGHFEYLLRIEVPDLTAYKRFHTDRLGTLRHVSRIHTHVVMGSPKDARG